MRKSQTMETWVKTAAIATWGATASCFRSSILSHRDTSQRNLTLKLRMMKRGQMQINATEKEKHPQGKWGQP